MTNLTSGNDDIKSLISHTRTIQTNSNYESMSVALDVGRSYAHNDIVESRAPNSFYIIWNCFHYYIRYFHQVRTMFG